jgi:hypothetical protein
MNKEMQIIREVNVQAENFYDDAVQLGDHAAYALTRAHRSQLTGLENIAESALKASDVLDYIKRQTARFLYWRQSFPREKASQEAFGERLKNYLEGELKTKRNAICHPKVLNIGEETDEDKTLQRYIYLLLIRQFIRQMVAEYEYRVSIE